MFPKTAAGAVPMLRPTTWSEQKVTAPARGRAEAVWVFEWTELYFVPKLAAKGANTSLVNSLYKSLILLASATNVSYADFAY